MKGFSMARVREYSPEDDDGGEYDPDDSDPGFDGYAPDDRDDDTETCPYCRAEIYAGSSACPKCGKYISKEDQFQPTLPGWIRGVALAVVIAMVLSVLAML